MTITVSDFSKITGISRHTIYSWIYRNTMPKGLKPAKTIGKARLLTISQSNEYYEKVSEKLMK